MTQFQLGSISTGTLKIEDLAPVFIEELLSRGVDAGDVPEDMDGLYNALESFCPPFVYFGAHEGVGADFGFWPDRDAIQEAIDPTSCLVRINANGDYVLEEDGVIVQVSDHGNLTVTDLERNVLWSVV